MLKKLFCVEKIKTVFLLIFSIFTLFSSVLPAQAQFNEYKCAVQFFDIKGKWVNSRSTVNKISKMDITTTLLNTYRIKPYFSVVVNGKTLAFPGDWVSVNISEKEMAYTTSFLGEARSLIIPYNVGNQQLIRVYTFVEAPDKTIIGIVSDDLVREERKNDPIQFPTLSPQQISGYWINEWQPTQILHQMHIKNIGNQYFLQMYDFLNQKLRAWGEVPITWDSKQGMFVATIDDMIKGTNTIFKIRPIMQNNEIQGLDLISEEFFKTGDPRNVIRQLFAKNPNSEKMEQADFVVDKLTGEWVNFEPKSPTSRLFIDNKELDLWISSSKEETGAMEILMGRKILEPLENKAVGAVFKGSMNERYIEIEPDLEYNKYFDTIAVIAVTTKIKRIKQKDMFEESISTSKNDNSISFEDDEENSNTTTPTSNEDIIATYTEIFRRKNAILAPLPFMLK